MPFPVDAEAMQTYEEGRSVLGSLVTRLMAIVQQIINYVMSVSREVFRLASEHPLGLTLGVCNLIIWMS